MRQLTLIVLAIALTTTSLINNVDAKRQPRMSKSQIAYAQALTQYQAQLVQAQSIPPSNYTNICEVFINFRSRPDVVVSGLTSLSQTECNNLKLDSSGVPFGGRTDPITDLITPYYYDGSGFLYHGTYFGISLNSAHEVTSISNQLYSHPSVAPQLFFLYLDGFIARGVWR